MPKAIDLAGKRFGRLVVTGRSKRKRQNGEVRWWCECDCGVLQPVEVSGYSLRKGRTTSCGCARETHGLSSHPLYATWKAMIRRCYDPGHERYLHYGGRGIRVCERWRDSLQDFIDDVGKRPESCTLDRINNNGNYEPGNVRWATVSEQNKNRSTPMGRDERQRLREEVDMIRTLAERVAVGLDGLEEDVA